MLAARPSAHSATLSALGKSGVRVLADDFSLKERGISKLAEGVAAVPIDIVVDHLELVTKLSGTEEATMPKRTLTLR